MEIIERIKHRSVVRIFFVSFGIFVILFAISYVVLGGLCINYKARRIYARHTICYHQLRNYRAHVGGALLPPELKVVPIGENAYYLKDFDTDYYPDAWDKPGQVLFRHRWRNFHFVVFGDGTRANVSDWSYRGDDPNVEPQYFRTLAEKYNYGYIWFIPLGAVTIAITIVVTTKEQKKGKDSNVWQNCVGGGD